MANEEVERILVELAAIQSAPEMDAEAFDRARSLIGHADNDVRWQALIAVSNWIYAGRPEPVWEVVLEHGESEDDDMRMGVATVLLEHLLEHYFDDYFPRVRARIEAGAPLLKDTLGSCCRFGQSDEQWAEVCRLSGQTWRSDRPS